MQRHRAATVAAKRCLTNDPQPTELKTLHVANMHPRNPSLWEKRVKMWHTEAVEVPYIP